jgi:hypothetical protein
VRVTVCVSFTVSVWVRLVHRLFERDRAIDFRFTEDARESECQQTGDDAHEHASQEETSNHAPPSQ